MALKASAHLFRYSSRSRQSPGVSGERCGHPREFLASDPESISLAFEVLRTKYTCDVKLQAEGEEERVDVEKLLYSQRNIKKAFQRGSPSLEDAGRSHPRLRE